MHAYPAQLADFVLDHWPRAMPAWASRRLLVELLSTCFQASLAQEEGRNVRFRLLSAGPAELEQLVQANDFLRFEFTEPHPFTADNVRRLSPAAPFPSSVIAAAPVDDDTWAMTNIVHTGASWLAPTWGGRRAQGEGIVLPMVHVLGPGRIGVYAGAELVASLEGGMIQSTTTDVFTSKWLNNLFRRSRLEVKQALDSAAGPRSLNESLVRTISQYLVRRIVVLIRQAGHGGLILFADPDLVHACCAGKSDVLKLKYAFRGASASNRYRELLERLAQLLGPRGDGEIDLQRFLEADTPDVARVEQSVFELSRLVSGLAAVDGAVLLNKRFELIGFGAEVSGELPYPDTVWQALDVEGERRDPEAANSVGTRHRAAYRFVSAHPAGVAVVISHDGIVRFVANLGGEVVFWDQFLNW
jgi:sensor domain DACNV-containing protein